MQSTGILRKSALMLNQGACKERYRLMTIKSCFDAALYELKTEL